MKKRIDITIDEELDCMLNKYCKEHFCSKSSIISLSVVDYLVEQEFLLRLRLSNCE